jgi:hypothetical protein
MYRLPRQPSVLFIDVGKSTHKIPAMIRLIVKSSLLLALGTLGVLGLHVPALRAADAPAVPAINPALLDHYWPAQWIAPASASSHEYGVFHFRRRFTLPAKPDHFVIHISADNRYRLYVNGRQVSFGPARGDLPHWRFETLDLAPYLVAGDNALAVLVWNYGGARPINQMSHQTGLIVQGNGGAEAIVNSGGAWKVLQNQSHHPIAESGTTVGPFDGVEGAREPWGWEQTGYDDSKWGAPRGVGQGVPAGIGSGTDWALVPRNIPAMELTEQRIPTIRRATGITPTTGFLAGTAPMVVPAQCEAVLLLDQGFLTTAFPQLRVSGGKGSEITITYSEALYDSAGNKGNRNDIEGRHIAGNHDFFLPDGGEDRVFDTLWFRTYRYIEMKIKTGDAPVTIQDFHGLYTGYPFVERAHFSSSDAELETIWKTGWRTARLCAGETYYDCPYYEQLQYVGDTRIQSLISLYVTGDDRLMRNAIMQFDNSRIPEGLTQSRYPSSTMQIIPPFSLFWADMVHDYWMHRDDTNFIAPLLEGVHNVMAFHERHLDASGMLGSTPWWNFVDWPDQWPWDNVKNVGGVPSVDNAGRSAILSLQYAYALQRASELATGFHRDSEAAHYQELSERVVKATRQLCWDETRGLLADTPEKTVFSQHANALAVLTGLVTDTKARALMQNVTTNASLIPCTVYYRFYLYRAMRIAHMGNTYIEQLEPWRQMIRMGLSTFAERPEPTRSDCHAWSASPNYELLASVCGIEPASPGFKTVRIAPHPGALTWIKGGMPHPLGMIEVQWKRTGDKASTAEVTLPEGLSGTFFWKGKQTPLKPGHTTLDLRDP